MKFFMNTCLALLLLSSCARYNPKFTFDPSKNPAPPDYSKAEYWAALPEKVDPADRTPNATIPDNQATAQVDVFFLHPTTLLEDHKHGNVWNADLKDAKLNKITDDGSILYQASAFNGAGRVFAPRYRQAHYWSFFSPDKASCKQALDLAYSDVRNAFRYYLAHYNEGRPFILASHSQGARHTIQLLQEEIENTALIDQLVVAYIAGWPVELKKFKQIKPCKTPEETRCYCSWRTFERGYGLKNAREDSIVVTNPILWQSNTGVFADKSLNKGAVVKSFNKVMPGISDAQDYRGVLLCNKPKFPGSVFFRRKNYHIGDINLYYMDIRENAILRANTFTNR